MRCVLCKSKFCGRPRKRCNRWTMQSNPAAHSPGWRLSHGHLALAGGPAVGIDNLQAKDPMPPVLLYAPSASSSPADWRDFQGEDGPYQLIGWGYLAPYKEGSAPPSRTCVAAEEWFVHEAGWSRTAECISHPVRRRSRRGPACQWASIFGIRAPGTSTSGLEPTACRRSRRKTRQTGAVDCGCPARRFSMSGHVARSDSAFGVECAIQGCSNSGHRLQCGPRVI